MLTAEGVAKHYSGITALADVSMEVEAGEIVGLIGPNGSGKSTLLSVLSGFVRPDSGTVALDGRRIDRKRPWDVAGMGIRRTFQLPAQPERMTVLETMLVGADLSRGATIRDSLLRPASVRREQDEAIERARGLLDELTLLGHEHEAAGSLSGGQQKLLSLGVALMGEPRVLLLDEPTAGVHPRLRKTLVARLRAVNEAGTALVIVEHDMRFVSDLCARVYVLDKGSVVTCCTPAELTGNQRVVEAYLGTKAPPAGMARAGAGDADPSRGRVRT